MRAPVLAACFLVCAMAAANGAWAQAPQVRPGQTTMSPAATESKSTTAVLRGTVTATETGAPLARARVRITEVAPAGRGLARTVIADTSGRWEAGKLPAGRYRVSASKAPYVALEFGQRHPQEAGKEIVLAEGQTIEKLNLRLPRGAVIAGQVTDDLGDPAAAAAVEALRLRFVDGRRQLVSAGTPRQTDDLGNFRIYGLPPGRYVVRVRGRVWSALPPEDTGVSFAHTFHPSTTSAASATVITLGAGEEQGGVNVRRIVTRPARVTGTIVSVDGVPCPRAIVLLSEMSYGVDGASAVVTRNAADGSGRFVFSDVTLGDYSLVASPSESSSARGLANVAVAGADVEGVVVALHENARLSGRIEFEGGGAPASTAGVRISAPDTILAGSYGSAGVGSIADDWSFELTDVWPGERVIRLNGLSSDFSLKAVYVDGEDVTDTPREFSSRESLSNVRVVVTKRTTEVSGSVTDDRGRPVVVFHAIPSAVSQALS